MDGAGPALKINTSPSAWRGTHKAGRRECRNRPGPSLRSSARDPRPGSASRPGSALWDRSLPDQKWSLHPGHRPVIRPRLGLPSGPDWDEAPGRPLAH